MLPSASHTVREACPEGLGVILWATTISLSYLPYQLDSAGSFNGRLHPDLMILPKIMTFVYSFELAMANRANPPRAFDVKAIEGVTDTWRTLAVLAVRRHFDIVVLAAVTNARRAETRPLARALFEALEATLQAAIPLLSRGCRRQDVCPIRRIRGAVRPLISYSNMHRLSSAPVSRAISGTGCGPAFAVSSSPLAGGIPGLTGTLRLSPLRPPPTRLTSTSRISSNRSRSPTTTR